MASTSVTYDDLYALNMKLITTLKSGRSTFSRSDFAKIKTAAPSVYSTALAVYNLKRPSDTVRHIRDILDADVSLLRSANIEQQDVLTKQHSIISRGLDGLVGMASNVVSYLVDKISGAVIIPTTVVSGLIAALVMGTYTAYLKTLSTASSLFVPFRLVPITEGDLEQLLNTEPHFMGQTNLLPLDEVIDVSTATLALVGALFLKIAIAYSFGIDYKRKKETLDAALPGAMSMLLNPLVVIMVTIGTIVNESGMTF
jgi:hypothetical protein